MAPPVATPLNTSTNLQKENDVGETIKLRRSARLSSRGKDSQDENTESSTIIKKEMPFVKYEGRIVYITDFNEMAATADEIVQWIEQVIASSNDPEKVEIPLSFDMEWPFTFQNGPEKTSVIQIAVKEDCCYVFQLTKLTKLPAALLQLLKHPKVRLHGVNIKNDFNKLARDFPEVNAEDYKPKCVELGTWCNEIMKSSGRWSLARLVEFLLCESVDKNKKVRMSRWNVMPLDEKQLMYAAIDVYIGLRIYNHLHSLAARMQVKEEAITTESEIDAI